MRTDLTVVYYTSNREKPEFESRIQQALVENSGGLPIISVSQKPIDFGENICVGDVGCSAQNVFRQMQIGATAAKTKFVCMAESDIVYPPCYFEFRPRRDDTFYLAMPLWVLFAQHRRGKVFCLKPRGSESSMVVFRDTLLRRLEKMLAPLDQWGTQDADGIVLPFMLERGGAKKRHFDATPGVITFKTDQNLHRKTPHNSSSTTRELPYWGSSYDMLKRFCA